MTSHWKIHPAANLFPEMDEQEFKALVSDIAANGQQVPILAIDNQIIDGRHRLKACNELGIEPKVKEVNGQAGQSPAALVISLNLQRRHLTQSQKAMIAEKALPLLEAEARERQKAAGKHGAKGGRGKQNPSRTNAGRVSNKKSGEASSHAAALVGVSARYVDKAKLLRKHAPSLANQVEQGKITLSKAFRQYKRESDRKKAAAAPPITTVSEATKFQCIVIDPPWDVSDEGDVNQMGRANPDYTTMPIAEIEALPIESMAAPDCHLYIWITNRSLPKGFRLMESWGFRYVTMLTWCKESIGIGNYFRNNTEHVLFGVKGSLSLLRQDVGTWFTAPRGKKHSIKPQAFYDLVETCSPGPRVDIFPGRDRDGWAAWPPHGTERHG